MKKLIALLLAMAMILCLAACSANITVEKDSEAETTAAPKNDKEENKGSQTGDDKTPADDETQGEDSADPDESVPEETVPVESVPSEDETVDADVMTYAEYAAAAIDDAVTVECYVQAHQSWWENKITVYAQDADGAYFLYNMACSEEDAAKLTEGTKIRVTGFKGEWSGEIEIMDATFEFVEGAEPFIAEPMDVTELLASDTLINYQNQKVSFKGMTVVASNNQGAAFLYNWDGSGTAGNDLYFKASVNGAEYTFCVESYLTGDGTDVYEAVEALKVGDVIDMEGFLYWYEGVQPHIVSVTAAA